jgi:hypothetical protein
MATQAVRHQTEPPASVAERLRAWGSWPILLVSALTVIALISVAALDVSGLWLIAAVLIGGVIILALFSSRAPGD